MIELNLTFFIQIANFLILMVVLDRVLIRPMLRLLDERKATIDGAFHEANRLNEETRRMTEEIEKRLADARREIDAERQRAYMAAAREASQILEKADEEARRVVEKREEELRREAEETWKAIEAETVILAEKLLRRLRAA